MREIVLTEAHAGTTFTIIYGTGVLEFNIPTIASTQPQPWMISLAHSLYSSLRAAMSRPGNFFRRPSFTLLNVTSSATVWKNERQTQRESVSF